MTERIDRAHLRWARIAGAVYLAQAFFASVSLYVRSSLINADDAEATIDAILASELLFRAGMLSEVAVSLTWLTIAFCLYTVHRRAQPAFSLLFLVLVVIGAALINANAIFLRSALELIEAQGAAAAFDAPAQQSLGLIFLAAFDIGESVWALFAGLWLIPLGWVVYATRSVPRVLGVLLIVASLGYLVPIVVGYVSPAQGDALRILVAPAGLIETALGLWLLFRGAGASAEPIQNPS